MSNNKNKYVKLTHREHILKRPDTYIGGIECEQMDMYVVENCDLSDIKIVKKRVNNNPGLVKIFDEILCNASDHSIRTSKVKMIKIIIDDKKVTIENDGPTIPIEIHPTEKIYNQELIFSNLLTGENYDDEEERNTAGKNGYGSKLTNVFSKKFKVECSDGKKFYRQWTKNNMSIIEPPEITNSNDSKSFTRITYYPDFKIFNMDSITDDLKSIMYKRCVDVAAYIPNVRISVNGKTLPIKKMQDFMKMHIPYDSDLFYEELENGWKVGIAKSTGYGFEHSSIVNGVSTIRGGTALNYISLELSKDISNKFPNKIKANWMDVKNKLFLFLVCQINQPNFDTQTKEMLTNRMTNDITGGCKVSDKTIKKIMKSDIVRSILDEIELREKLSLKRMSGGKKKNISIEKLIDANKAGTKDSSKCSILLTEGDSALTSAVSGMSVVGREYYGAMPLKGKVLNVRSSSTQKIRNNKEIQNIIKILGLEIGKVYESTDELRYGKCVIYTDADCLHENTLIKTIEGDVMIKNLKVGDLVLTHDNTYKEIIGKRNKYTNNWIELIIHGKSIKCTKEHNFLIVRDGKVEKIKAENIKKTDLFMIKR